MPQLFSTCWSYTSLVNETLKCCTCGRVSRSQTWRVLMLFSAPSHLAAKCLSVHRRSRSNEANRTKSLAKKYRRNPEVIQLDTFHSFAASILPVKIKNCKQRWRRGTSLRDSMPVTQHLLQLNKDWMSHINNQGSPYSSSALCKTPRGHSSKAFSKSIQKM